MKRFILLILIGLVFFNQSLMAQSLSTKKTSSANFTVVQKDASVNSTTASGRMAVVSPKKPAGLPLVRCYTVEHEAERRQKNPNLPTPAEFEEWIQKKIESKGKNNSAGHRAGPYQIPVVVHVVHNGEAVGEGANISAAQVYSQIESLTEDFRRLNADAVNTPAIFLDRAADLQIEFVPATHDASGNLLAEPGIHRYDGGRAAWDMRDDIETVLKPATIWDPALFCNMWTMQFGTTPLADGGTGGLLGYAQFPEGSGLAGMPGGTQSGDTDGLVMGYQYFGNADKDPGNTFTLTAPYNKGRTTTHEIGHWVGLRHIWGDGGCTVDDYVDDTPTAANPNYDCDATYNSCGSGPTDEPDMTQNYMDYSSDPCMNMFTEGQKARVWAVMDNSTRRAELPASTAYTPTTNDIGISSVTFTKDCGGQVNGTAMITNFSTSNSLTSATINLYVDGSLQTSLNWAGSLAALHSEIITLPGMSLTEGSHTVEVRSANPNGTDDTNSSNDTFTTPLVIPNLSGNFSQNFETGTSALDDFILISGTESAVGVAADAANSSNFGLYLEGNSADGYPAAGSGPTEAEGFTSDHPHYASAVLCYDATNASSLQLSFDYMLNYGINNAYTNFRYRVEADNGPAFSSGVIQPNGSNTPWTPVSLNLDANVGGKIQIYFEANCKYPHNTDLNGVEGSGNGAYIENIAFTYATSLPEISLSSLGGSITETPAFQDGCRSYTDVQIPVEIANAPTTEAILNITTSGNAQNISDYELLTPSITFPAANTADQNLTIRVYDDQDVEAAESLTLNLVLANDTDATLNSGNLEFTLTINDNDAALSPNYTTQTLFTEDFESGIGAWTILTFPSHDASTSNIWRAGTQASITGQSAYVSERDNTNSYQNRTTELALRTPLIDATGMQDVAISFDYAAGGETDFDYGYLVYALESDPNNYTVLDGPYVLTGGTAYTVSGTLGAAFDNERFYLGWYWVNDGNTRTAPSLVIDNIAVTAQQPAATVATALNSTNSTYFGPYQTVHFYNDTDGKLIASLENTTAHDYGCTSVAIERAGTSSQEFWNPGVENSIFDKTLTVTPSNNNAAGSYNITLYYTEGEISGWETFTSKNRSVLKLAKLSGGSINDVSPGSYPAGAKGELSQSNTLAAFGSEWALTGSFTTGFSGFGAGDPGDPPAPLPVELYSFTAKPDQQNIALSWETLTEFNAEYFSIEYSKDGINFEEIGRKDATGFSNQLQAYAFRHQLPGSGRHYYRLRTVDFDHSYEYSKLVMAAIGSQGLQLMQLSPNPSRGQIRLITDAADDMPLQLYIRNLQGQPVYQSSLSVQRGKNSHQLDLNHLKAGVYLLELTDRYDVIRQKIILQ